MTLLAGCPGSRDGQPGAGRLGAPRVRALLARFGAPSRGWRLLAWSLAAATLALLAHHPGAFVLFFAVFPLLWIVQGSFRAGLWANLVFGLGIAVVGWACRDATWPATAAISTGFSLLMGLWMHRVHQTRFQAVQALADKEEALRALARAQGELAAAERAAGRSAERERWAREVHDTLAQGFVSVIALSQAARSELAGGETDVVGRRLDQLETIARDNLAEARSLVAGQGPPALDTGDLLGALERLVAAQRQEGRGAQLRAGPLPGLTRAQEVVVLRTVQEALSNVTRHSGAGSVRVGVSVDDLGGAGELVVTISDDGVGAAGRPEGTGLTGMRSRVESAGGTLTVDPAHAPDARGCTGTVVEARMPL